MKRIILTLTLALFTLPILNAQDLPSYVPTEGLVAYYPFNGNANDQSGNGNNGTVTGATLTNDRFGNSNSAYQFDGVDDRVVITSNNLPSGNSARSVSAWFYTESGGGNIFAYGEQIIADVLLELKDDAILLIENLFGKNLDLNYLKYSNFLTNEFYFDELKTYLFNEFWLTYQSKIIELAVYGEDIVENLEKHFWTPEE